MEKDKEFQRNRPAEEGRSNDPHIRDEDARRPGVSTMSSTPNDEANEDLTETAADNFDEEPRDPKADKRFDEAGHTGSDE